MMNRLDVSQTENDLPQGQAVIQIGNLAGYARLHFYLSIFFLFCPFKEPVVSGVWGQTAPIFLKSNIRPKGRIPYKAKLTKLSV